MYSLAKDLLFLHGHITRPEDLDPTLAAREAPAERRDAQTTRKDAPPIDDACLTC